MKMKKCIIVSFFIAFVFLNITFFSCTKSTENKSGGIETFSAEWLKIKDLTVAVSSNTPRMYAVSFTIGDTAAYVGTGDDGRIQDSLFSDFYKYSITTGTWNRIADLQIDGVPIRRQRAVAFSLNGKGYVGTGLDKKGNFYNDFYCYDPVSDSWTKIANLPGVARARATAFSLNGKGYVIGGATYNNKYLSDVYVYDPATNSWTADQGLPYDRLAGASSFVINGKGYVLGGWDGSGLAGYFLQFDPNNTPHWSSLMQIDTAKFAYFSIERTDGVALPIGSDVYFVSGANIGGTTIGTDEASPNLSSWKWNFSSGSWTKGPDFPEKGRWGALGFVLQNNAFVGTGIRDTTGFNNFYELKP